jgi:Kef-type K+ transport system membrane component KefB
MAVNITKRQGRGGPIINLVMVALTALVLWLILDAGKALEVIADMEDAAIASRPSAGFFSLGDTITFHHPLSVLILQILVIILASRILGWIMSLINQPTVIGEIMAGIMLGPSLLGLYFPGATEFLFPAESLGNLQFLSQIGLILFMFIIGMELDIGILRQRAGAAVFISNASIVVPFVMGVGLSYFLFSSFTTRGNSFLPFALFMGIAMSITAFPVLARIVQERGMTRTPLGMTAITCAAVNDITAWGILALVVAIANAGAIGGALLTILLSFAYVLLMLLVVRPLLSRIARKYTVRETISKLVVAMVLSTMLISAYITEVIGIHALFGAFMAGVIMPDNLRFKQIMAEKLEDVSLVLLLPLFFVYTGLRTEIGLINDPDLWLTALWVIAVAVTGKFAGSALAAKLTGQSWRDSLMIGALMNTRGLIELVALNIGYDIGVLSPEIFTILVLMALVTTFMTGPAMAFIQYLYPSGDAEKPLHGQFRVLVAFGPPEAGGRLTALAHMLMGKRSKQLRITALHLTPNTEISMENARQFEEEAFSKVNAVSSEYDSDVNTVYRTAENVSQEIVRTANRGKFDLLLVGSSRPLLSQDETGGRARYFFDNTRCMVGLFIDKGIEKINSVLIISASESERYLYDFTAALRPGYSIDSTCLLPPSVPVKGAEVNALSTLISGKHPADTDRYDLIIASVDCYRDQREAEAEWVDGKASILLLGKPSV